MNQSKPYRPNSPSSAYHGGFFITAMCPKKTNAELTKVNKPAVTNSFTSHYKTMIFPIVKPGVHGVNKFNTLTTTYCNKRGAFTLLTFYLITLLTNYQIIILHPQNDGLTEWIIKGY
jgi:hypothetical protein